jgi:MoxR-vWA-beta-propeller ternary system protein
MLMTLVPLQIRFTTTRIREPQAWFIPGSSPANWLGELVDWGVPHSSLSLRLVPRSLGDRTVIGSLVTVDGKALPRVSRRCQPYGCLVERLYLPVEAGLEPTVEEFELGDLLDAGATYAWHPVAGLIKFDAGDKLSVGDLLEQLSETPADWDRADPGTTFSRRLVSVEVDRLLSIESILEAGRSDIGSRSDALDQLPAVPGEGFGASLARIVGVPLLAIGSAIDRIASKLPGLPKTFHISWLDRLNQWLSTALSTEWQSERERELRRLMEMLKNEPDEGLQYALPLEGASAPGRGIARPTARLIRRLIDFHLWPRSAPADPWLLSPAMRQNLAVRYRELADREIRLGRHRRAAYIYAHLLGDWAASAAALKSGGYHREAATLYQERLNRPYDAALCLEEEGAWNEAIRLYDKLRMYEKVGQLYRKLEQHEDAECAFRQAVAFHLEHADRLAAARLLEDELRETEQAIVALREGWPGSRQAAKCLQAEFGLLGRLGRHAAAESRLCELRDQPLNPVQVGLLAPLLALEAQQYPDFQVRAAAADTTRIVVSRRLVQLQHTKLPPDRRLIEAIQKLAPEDRLLERDCARFLREGEARVALTPAIRRIAPMPRVVHSSQLDPALDWRTGTGTTEYLFIAGYRLGKMILERRQWTEIYELPQKVVWDAPAVNRHPILLAPCPCDQHEMWIQVRGAGPFSPRTIAVSGAHEKTLSIRTPPWSNADTVALARTEQGVSWQVAAGRRLVVNAFAADGTPILSREIPTDDFVPLPTQSIPVHARAEGLFFAIGNRLMSVDGKQRMKPVEFDDPIVALSSSPAHTRLRLAVSFPQGGAVFWRDSSSMRRFGDALSQPHTVFTLSGNLVAIDAGRIEIYRLDRHDLKLESTAESPGQPLAVMRVRTNEFAILDAAACLRVYRISN